MPLATQISFEVRQTFLPCNRDTSVNNVIKELIAKRGTTPTPPEVSSLLSTTNNFSQPWPLFEGIVQEVAGVVYNLT